MGAAKSHCCFGWPHLVRFSQPEGLRNFPVLGVLLCGLCVKNKPALALRNKVIRFLEG